MPKKLAAAVALGRRGGRAKVPKGFAMLSRRKRLAIARAAAAKRWGNS